ncbi:hypothetical protein B0H14DRAFT_2581968 [Mycena olivaceomarginata]|nr:hypothetical protein B0H14DRAFT_2581968 [Mycena olivaceomarginata]
MPKVSGWLSMLETSIILDALVLRYLARACTNGTASSIRLAADGYHATDNPSNLFQLIDDALHGAFPFPGAGWNGRSSYEIAWSKTINGSMPRAVGVYPVLGFPVKEWPQNWTRAGRDIGAIIVRNAPTSPTTAERILKCAANALQEIAGLAHIPFLGSICALTLTIIPMVQNTRSQKERCIRIVEDIHHLVCVLTGLSIQSEDIQSPKILYHIAQFAITLQKVDSCLRAQQELGTITRLFKQSELVGQLGACETELKVALDSFTREQAVGILSTFVKLNADTETRHQELLELISTQSGSLDAMSSIGRSSLNVSSGSFSLLPASPKIFHGRETELEHLVDNLLADPARVAILGPGGIGKTALAVTVLHSMKVVEKYPIRHFIPCDSVQTNNSLVATIGSHLGLEGSQSSTRHIITMRGAERPSKVQWTHPFLHPLSPLSSDAAHQTFIEIADEIHDVLEVDQLLEITDHIPLAVQLVANIAASEGCQATLARWKVENTALLSAGYDKRSNLEISIKLSLSSPRMASLLHAVDLLGLLSLLSDGISETDLVQSKPPIPEIAECKTTLLRTSLAFIDHAGRLKVLAPIRDYVQTTIPLSPHLVRPLRKYFNDLLRLWRTFIDSSSGVGNLTPHLLTNLGNMHNLLVYGLNCDPTDTGDTARAIILLNQLNMLMERGLTPLMLRLQEMLPQINDHHLYGQFIVEAFRARWFHAIPDPEKYMDEAIEHFRIVNDIEGEARLYIMVGRYYADTVRDHKKAQNLYHRALTFEPQCTSPVVRVGGLSGLATIECLHGSWSEGLRLGRETQKIAVSAGDVRAELNSLHCQARCYIGLGDFKHGIQVVDQWKALVLRTRMQGGESHWLLMNFEGEIHQLRTEYAQARQAQEVILSQTSPVLSPANYAYCLLNLVSLDLVIGANTAPVSQNLHTAVEIFRRINYPRAFHFLCEGDTAGARTSVPSLMCMIWTMSSHAIASVVATWAFIFFAFVMRPAVRGILPVHQALQNLGNVFTHLRKDEEALSILTVALEGFTRWTSIGVGQNV